MRLLILVITASGILASSCTIQKRTFRNGYYISWNKSVKKVKTQSKEEEQLAETEVLADTCCKTEPKVEESAISENPDTVQIMELTHLDGPVLKEMPDRYSETALAEPLDENPEGMDEKNRFETEEEKVKKTPNLFAINSLVFAIGYVVLSFITIYTSLFVLAIISFLLALALAIIAIIKWKRNKGDFWGTFFAVIALGLLVLGTLIFLLFIVAGSL